MSILDMALLSILLTVAQNDACHVLSTKYHIPCIYTIQHNMQSTNLPYTLYDAHHMLPAIFGATPWGASPRWLHGLEVLLPVALSGHLSTRVTGVNSALGVSGFRIFVLFFENSFLFGKQTSTWHQSRILALR